MKILIIEDDNTLAINLKDFLIQEGYLCEDARDYFTAEEKIHLYKYDIILVDLGLPGGDGLRLIPQIRYQNTLTGIIVITARNAVDDRIKGLESGADDYLTKPFHLPELHARIRALARRRLYKGEDFIDFEEIRLNPESREVLVQGIALDLRKKEFELLQFFLLNSRKVLSKSAIAEHLWGDFMDTADRFDFLYNHIKNLRKKIREAGGKDYIHTVYGLGYKFSQS